MKPNKYFDVSGCNCPELNTVKISQADGLPQREIQLPEEMSDKIKIETTSEGLNIEVAKGCEITMPLQIQNMMSGKANAQSLNRIKIGRFDPRNSLHIAQQAVCRTRKRSKI